MTGLTLKQYYRRRYFDLCRQIRDAKKAGDTKQLVPLSVQVHIAKGSVPKYLWRFGNRIMRGEE